MKSLLKIMAYKIKMMILAKTRDLEMIMSNYAAVNILEVLIKNTKV